MNLYSRFAWVRMENLMPDAPTPKKGYRTDHKRLPLEHANSVPDREDVTKLSDFDLIERLHAAQAKPIASDAAHTSPTVGPIPTPPANRYPLRHPLTT